MKSLSFCNVFLGYDFNRNLTIKILRVIENFLKQLIVWYIVILPAPGLYCETFRLWYMLNQRCLTAMITTAV